MKSFETEIKSFLQAREINYTSRTDSFNKLDFEIEHSDAMKQFYFDAKEKRQKYRTDNWPTNLEEKYFFIFDDLACRKALAYAPDSAFLVRDSSREVSYYLFTIVDILLMPKTRVNRTIHKENKKFKGKWLIDLRNGQKATELEELFEMIDEYLANKKEIFTGVIPCYGNYEGESIEGGGITRRPKHWKEDWESTR